MFFNEKNSTIPKSSVKKKRISTHKYKNSCGPTYDKENLLKQIND